MMTLAWLMGVSCRDELDRGLLQDDVPDYPLETAKIHGEVSEAFEAWRKREPHIWHTEEGKPEGIAIEFADAVILIASFCKRYKIPLEEAIKIKLQHNRTRPALNGKRC